MTSLHVGVIYFHDCLDLGKYYFINTRPHVCYVEMELKAQPGVYR